MREILPLLLGASILLGLAVGAHAGETLNGGRDPQRTGLPQEGRTLALNARQVDSPLLDPLDQSRFVVELIGLPAAFMPGQIGKVRVKVSNADDHQLLTGLPDGRDLWIDLKLLDAKGRELYRRAAIKASRAVAELGFMVPADAIGPVTVQADLNYRPVALRSSSVGLNADEPDDRMTRLASAAGQVPLAPLRPGVAEQMRRLLLLLSAGRTR